MSTRDPKTAELRKTWRKLDEASRLHILGLARRLAGIVEFVGGPMDGKVVDVCKSDFDCSHTDWWSVPEHSFECSPGRDAVYQWDQFDRLAFTRFDDTPEELMKDHWDFE